MPICDFIESCRLVRPGLRILMASGFSQTEMRFFGITFRTGSFKNLFLLKSCVWPLRSWPHADARNP